MRGGNSGTTASASITLRSIRLHGWIALHPDDGRFILTNGYDWTYFQVDDAPYASAQCASSPNHVVLELSDETEEALAADTLRVGRGDALYAKVKGGDSTALHAHAQTALARS